VGRGGIYDTYVLVEFVLYCAQCNRRKRFFHTGNRAKNHFFRRHYAIGGDAMGGYAMGGDAMGGYAMICYAMSGLLIKRHHLSKKPNGLAARRGRK